MKNTVRNYLSQNTCQYYPGETQYSNLLKLAMMQLWRQLVLFGHYHEEELGDVVKETRKILDFNSMRFRSAAAIRCVRCAALTVVARCQRCDAAARDAPARRELQQQGRCQQHRPRLLRSPLARHCLVLMLCVRN